MGSTCRQMCQESNIELPNKQQQTTSKKYKLDSNKISIQISIDQNKENTRNTPTYQANSAMNEDDADNTINDYNRIEANGIEVPELTGDNDRVDSIQLTENIQKEKPISMNSLEMLSVGSKKTILKKETRYSIFRNQADHQNDLKKVRFLLEA